MAVDNSQNKKFSNFPNLTVKTVLVAVLILVLAATSLVLYSQNLQAKAELKKASTKQEDSKAENESLVKKISQIIELPADETPTVATVVDASKLKSQAFFASAENGDKVLMYPKAKKAYLYRPGGNKLIEVATLDIKKAEQPQPTRTNTNNRSTTSGNTSSNNN